MNHHQWFRDLTDAEKDAIEVCIGTYPNTYGLLQYSVIAAVKENDIDVVRSILSIKKYIPIRIWSLHRYDCSDEIKELIYKKIEEVDVELYSDRISPSELKQYIRLSLLSRGRTTPEYGENLLYLSSTAEIYDVYENPGRYKPSLYQMEQICVDPGDILIQEISRWNGRMLPEFMGSDAAVLHKYLVIDRLSYILIERLRLYPNDMMSLAYALQYGIVEIIDEYINHLNIISIYVMTRWLSVGNTITRRTLKSMGLNPNHLQTYWYEIVPENIPYDFILQLLTETVRENISHNVYIILSRLQNKLIKNEDNIYTDLMDKIKDIINSNSYVANDYMVKKIISKIDEGRS
jgi:hypothetical protein